MPEAMMTTRVNGRDVGSGQGISVTVVDGRIAAIEPTDPELTTGPYLAAGLIDLQVNGSKVTGSVRQGGADGEPVPIYFGTIEGNTVSFKANSPDGDRIVTFTGKITRIEIGFSRQVEVRPGGTRGDTGILGGNAVSYFSARRPAPAQ